MREYYYEANNKKHLVTIQKISDNLWKAIINDRELDIYLDERQSTRLDVRMNGRGFHCHIDAQGLDRYVSWKGSTYTLRKSDESKNDIIQVTDSNNMTMDPEIRSPMPGRVIKIFVSEGDEVTKNQQLLILEAMKMEFIIRASINGTIEKVFISENGQVDLGQTLVSLSFQDE